MPKWKARSIIWLLGFLLATVPSATAQPPASSPFAPQKGALSRSESRQSRTSAAPQTGQTAQRRLAEQRQMSVAVMGNVARSGAYTLNESRASLGHLLHRAGGVTREATGSIRILRNGRVTLQTHLTSGSKTLLKPGDVVLAVGSKVGQLRIYPRRSGHDETTSSHIKQPADDAPAAPNRPVEIALLNLIDRPVVLRLRPEHARLDTLVALLRQPEELVENTRLIQPGRQDNPPPAGKQTSSLTDGTVLVFDRRFVRPDAIPRLPPVFGEENAIHEPTGFRRNDRQVVLTAGPDDDAAGSSTGHSSSAHSSSTNPSPPGDVQTAKHARVAALLRSARDDLEAGRLQQARAKALAAQRENTDSRLLQDRPELILAEIERRRSAQADDPHAAPDSTSPGRLDDANPPPAGHQPFPDSHRAANTSHGAEIPATLSGRQPSSSNGRVSSDGPFADNRQSAPTGDGTGTSPQPGGNSAASSPMPVDSPVGLGGATADPSSEVAQRTASERPATTQVDNSAPAAASTPTDGESTGAIDVVTLIIGLFAGLGVLSAAGFLWSMASKATAISASNAELTVRRATRTLLQRLIGKEVDVTEEALPAMKSLQFFGRSPDSNHTRFDAPHVSAGQQKPKPHLFRQRSSSQPAADAAPVSAEAASTPFDASRQTASGTDDAAASSDNVNPNTAAQKTAHSEAVTSKQAASQRPSDGSAAANSPGVIDQALSRVLNEGTA